MNHYSVRLGVVWCAVLQRVSCLQAARVIDSSNRWIAGNAHLVQTGDVLDRGPTSKQAMDLLMRLEDEAGEAGG